MGVDVTTAVEIHRPRLEVAPYALGPSNVTAWYQSIKRVDWLTAPPVVVGSKVAFVAQFLGRGLDYTYEVRALEPGTLLVMQTDQGSFPMETTYTWADSGEGMTRILGAAGG